MLTRRELLLTSSAICAASAAGVCAQEVYPNRPIRLVVPFTPGASTDAFARRYAHNLTQILGQPVVVENKPGASGIVGSLDVRNSKPDGYSLVVGVSTSHLFMPLAARQKPYDPVKDFTPIMLGGIIPMVLLSSPSFPATSLPEAIKLIKEAPGKYSYGSSGYGGVAHLTGELVNRKVGLDIVHVPYRGGGAAQQDLLAGVVPLIYDTFSTSLPLISSGRMRALAVFAEKRSSVMSEVPTAMESGIDIATSTWSIVMGPPNLPPAVVRTLSEANAKIYSDEQYRRELQSISFEIPTDTSPDGASRFLNAELAKWKPVVDAAGIQLDL